MSADRRWPRQVYGAGTEPDPRFTLANERTFLAWIRTALALVAAGVAVDAVDLGLAEEVRLPLAVVLVGLGVVCALGGWVRWGRVERALRRSAPLPGSPLGALLALGVLVAAVLVLVSLR
ncbi:DUF202 domain-containing protein [Nocardioides sp. ChNu-153]|uniref:YidH family protein n=1 Tax=unclassified Nocardioides TaxID=2615069 RepID=UPI0024049492|nr:MULTISPECIES: DUF202 domain-containing protein [unclassified Nocardioides]MDF9714680.1 DUF202 domain-containing protein [Nocardioides sp. ChNu-99]MDN7119787.1 DUF202 domain-containing protein [Nocardioides sp. ChNu-153]